MLLAFQRPSLEMKPAIKRLGGNQMRRRSAEIVAPHHFTRQARVLYSSSVDEEDGDGEEVELNDPRLYHVDLPSATGIKWGSDLSLRWPRVLGFDDGSAAGAEGSVEIGDQLVAIDGEAIIGSKLTDVIDMLRIARAKPYVGLDLFRGSDKELQLMLWKAQNGGDDAPPMPTGRQTVDITVIQPGKENRVLTVPMGANLRDVLVANGVQVYRQAARILNCSGKQLCGTCIVDVQGEEFCSRRSIDEASTLRENPSSYRLSCVTDVYGDITVEVQVPVGKSQWTR